MSSTFTQSIPPGKIVLTYENYCLLPNDRNRYEILDGELSVTPVPRTKHQSTSGALILPCDITSLLIVWVRFMLRPPT